MKLKDRVAIVTGTSPNIGGGIAEGLAAEGAIIVAVDARADNANDCANYINRTGGRALGLVCDVTDEAQVKATVDAAFEEFGKVDILVNNAAFFNRKGVLDMSYAEFTRQSGVILGGTFLFTKYVAQAMIGKGGGVMINIVSTAGHQGEPGNIAYSTSKCGLLNFTRSAAMELVGHGIRVNSLTPTATDPVRILRTRGALGPHRQEAREPRPPHEAVPRRHPDEEAASAERLWKGRRVPRVGRFGDDHRHRPQGRRRRHRPLLGLGSEGRRTL